MPQPALIAPMPASAPRRPAAAAEYTITQCHRCDYPLAGLPHAGRCPECNTAVADSLRGWELRFASRGYVRVLSRGLGLAIPAMLLMYALWCAQGLLTLLDSFVGSVRLPASVIYGLALGYGLSVVGLGLGFWWFTTPEPAAPARCPQRRWSRFGRMQICMVVSATMLWLTLSYYGHLIYSLPAQITAWLLEVYPVLVQVLVAVMFLGMASTIFSIARYATVLARRADDLALVRWYSVLQWVLPAMVLVGFGWNWVIELRLPSDLFEQCANAAVAIAAISLRRLHGHLRAALGVAAEVGLSSRLQTAESRQTSPPAAEESSKR